MAAATRRANASANVAQGAAVAALRHRNYSRNFASARHTALKHAAVGINLALAPIPRAITMSRRLVPPAPLASLGLAALLAGCAGPVPKHVAVTAGPSAQLIMRGSVQPGETFGVYLFQEPQSCSGLEQVGIGTANVNPATTTIAANRLSTAEVLLTKPNRATCRVRWSFDTVPGRKYLVSASSTPTGCTARILDATDPRKIVAEPSSRRRDVGGKLCIPMAQTTSLVDAAARARAESESDLPIAAAPAPSKRGTTPRVTEDDLGGLIGK